ncbi:MAG TPA: SLATT domain-containing protein [Allosphingosinicella sp.]|nr:SLATT domain-containing protein [Allosphingosinicella sp.]
MTDSPPAAPPPATPPAAPPAASADLARLIEEWSAGIRIIHIAHTRAAADYARWERVLGLGVAIITAITGSTVFANAEGGNQAWLFAAGALTIAAAVVAAAHTFLDFGALAAQHAAAAREYGTLRREFEAELVFDKGADLDALAEKVRNRWGEIEAKTPFVSQKRYAQAQKVVAQSAERRRQQAAEGAGQD